jgi:hypothetical protein
MDAKVQEIGINLENKVQNSCPTALGSLLIPEKTLHKVGQIPAQNPESASIRPPASFWSFKSF